MQSCQNEKMTKRARKPSLFPIEFFKIYFSSFSSNHLILPPAPSAILLVNKIPNDATLQDHKGKIWNVELEKAENSLVVKDGWQDFVAYHSLKDGEFLTFEYDGDSRFNVEIYGKNGLKRGKVLDYYMFDFHLKEEEDKETVENRSPPSIQKKNSSGPKIKRGRGRPPKMAKADSSTVAELEIATFPSIENPQFEITIGQSKSARYCFSIPRFLVATNKIVVPSELKLRDYAGKLWPVKVLPRQDIGGRITTGWVNFYQKHKLKPGDKCIFEFILERDNVGRILQVHIVRRKPDTTQRVVKEEIIAD